MKVTYLSGNISKCSKCGRSFAMSKDFTGTIICEDCDPFMRAAPIEQEDDVWDELKEIVYSGPDFTWYEHILPKLKNNFILKRKQ